MKTKQTIVCGLLAVMYALSLGACSGGGGELKITGPTDSFKFEGRNSAWGVSKGTATEGAVNIPAGYRISADYDYLPVIAISSSAFAGCAGLTKITIPNSVTEIGANAFNRCTGLTKVTIPASVTEIGSFAFIGCTGLTSITIPESVTDIYSYAFSDCTSLTSITIPESVTEIGSGVFSGWTASQTIKIKGKANEAEADSAWGEGWRKRFEKMKWYDIDAKIVYQGK